MSRDVITVGSTIRIPLLYRGEHSQWREWFMNYLEEQMDATKLLKTYGMLFKGRCVVLSKYGTLMRQTKNLMDINIDALYNILKQNQGDVNDALGYKKKVVVITSDPLALVAEKTKVSKCKEKVEVQTESEGSDDEDISDLKRIIAFLPTRNKSLSSQMTRKLKRKMMQKNNDDQEIFHDAIESASENFIENHIDSQKDYDKSEVDHNDTEEKEHLIDKLFLKFNHKIAKCQKRIEKANQQSKDLENQNKDLQEKYDVLINQVNTFEEQNNKFNEQMKVLNEKNAVVLAQTKVLQDQLKVKHVMIDTHTECQAKYAKLKEERYEHMLRYSALCDNDKQHRKKIDEQEILFDKMSQLEGCVSNKDVEIEKCLERLNECENKLHKIRQTNQTIHMIMPSKDTLYNGRKGIGFENPSYFEKAKDLRPSLYDEKVIGLGYTLMFLIHSDEALEIKKFKRARENKIEFAYDYGNLNASYQTSALKPYVSIVVLEKIIIDLEDEVHMTGNRALLTNFVEKFLGTVCFGNNDFAVITGYGDVVIGSMTINKVYNIKGLGHNLFRVEQFCDKGLEVAFRKSPCFVRNEDGVDLLTGDHSSNLYTIALYEVASNSCLPAKASSSQS
nr:integrase, catalytic region, zinc finger, CCHC-type, peptidase aspartic, catalytic [Tanacetum cinerariifolium]